jgi:microcystin-dependent protein
MVLVVQGTNSAVYQVVAPLNQPKMYVVYNNTTGGYAISIGAASGSVITIPNGVTAQVYTDGTNFYSAQTGSAGNFNVNGNENVLGNLSVGGTLTVTGITNIIPTGVIQMWPTVSAPTGFLNCDGSAVSRTTYAALYAVVGTTFGSGDGSTTFNLPNYTNRMPYGTTIGSTGGSSTTTLDGSNLPAHTHSFSGSGSTNSASANIQDPSHNHGINSAIGANQGSNQGFGAGGLYPPTGYINGTANATTGIYDAGHAHSVSISGTTGSAGSGVAATTISPYLGINFIIKT